MKYRVTEKHELLKEGITLEPFKKSTDEYFSSAWAHTFAYDEINDWLASGWIEEVQEPEFTKDEMIEFGVFCIDEYRRNGRKITYDESFRKFMNCKGLNYEK